MITRAELKVILKASPLIYWKDIRDVDIFAQSLYQYISQSQN